LSARRCPAQLTKVGDRSVSPVAKELDLMETTLRGWIKRGKEVAGKGPPVDTP
jgi:transposase-like protein